MSTDRWFSYDPAGNGYETHPTEALARQAAARALDYYRDDASSEGWSEDVDSVVWGEIRGAVVCTDRRKVEPEDASEYFDEIHEYELRDLDAAPISAVASSETHMPVRVPVPPHEDFSDLVALNRARGMGKP